jgi:hypothetical protein
MLSFVSSALKRKAQFKKIVAYKFVFESHFCKSIVLFDRPKTNQKGATEPMVP